MKGIVVPILLLTTLCGCSSFQLSSTKKEVIVDKVSPNIVTVTFCGNAYMTQKEVEKYALQRASREALSKGCSHFMIVKKEDRSKVCSLSTKGDKNYTHNTLATQDLGYLPYSEFVEPNVTLTIQCINKLEKIPAEAIDAEKFLRDNFPGLEK